MVSNVPASLAGDSIMYNGPIRPVVVLMGGCVGHQHREQQKRNDCRRDDGKSCKA